ncbi:MAG TPA: hypothetical protein EYP98_04575, partial [Planctomycetes bacterium]|nr:hypothetical protein [Planctomycetota bacterium]
LEFTDGALSVLAAEAMKRETGVRSLRSMLEEVLLEIRYDIAKHKGGQVVITEEYVINSLKRGPQSLLTNTIEPSSKSLPTEADAKEETEPPTEKSPMPRKRDSA